MKSEDYVFFWDGPFSQWHPSMFWDLDVALQYNCAEQFMMYNKAKFFGDTESMDKIMEIDNPRDQKQAGKEITPYDDKKWASVRYEIVKNGNKLKFGQNIDLMASLTATAGKTIVEASPYDRIWGIGLGEEDERIHDPSKWRGENLLGKLLTELRIDLIGN
jgi:ribA/ribD-fused uncharacterized protein